VIGFERRGLNGSREQRKRGQGKDGKRLSRLTLWEKWIISEALWFRFVERARVFWLRFIQLNNSITRAVAIQEQLVKRKGSFNLS